MKKSALTLGLTAFAGLALVAGTGLASAATITPRTVPYSASSSDGGTCGNQWAVDLYNRVFTIPAPDQAGNYKVVEYFKNGQFSTTAGVSPGACDTGTANDHTVREGIHGTFSGKEHLFIQGGTYTAGDGTCNGFPTSDAANPCTTNSYIAYHYPGGTRLNDTSYTFTYKTLSALALGTKTWKEVSTGGAETDTGDIYTSGT